MCPGSHTEEVEERRWKRGGGGEEVEERRWRRRRTVFGERRGFRKIKRIQEDLGGLGGFQRI